MRNNEPQSKTTTVEFERELDNKDITEVDLTGCQGQGGRRAQMAASFEGPSRRALVPSSLSL